MVMYKLFIYICLYIVVMLYFRMCILCVGWLDVRTDVLPPSGPRSLGHRRTPHRLLGTTARAAERGLLVLMVEWLIVVDDRQINKSTIILVVVSDNH